MYDQMIFDCIFMTTLQCPLPLHCSESAGVKESFTKYLLNNHPIIQSQSHFFHSTGRPMLSSGKFFTNIKFY